MADEAASAVAPTVPVNTGSAPLAPPADPSTPSLTHAQGVELLNKRFAPKVETSTEQPENKVEKPISEAAAEIDDLDPKGLTEDDVAAQTPEELEQKPETDDKAVVFTLEDGTPVTAAEARAGYVRHQEHEERTKHVTEVRRVAEARVQVIDQAAEFYAQRIPWVIDQIKSSIPAEPSQELRQTDPGRYWDQYNERLVKQRQVDQLEAETGQLKAHRDHVEALKAQELFANEAAMLMDKLPSWKNPRIAAQERSAISAYAREKGYSDQELSGIDHRGILVMRDAVLGAKVRANNKANGLKGAPNPTVTGKQTSGIVTPTPATSKVPSPAPAPTSIDPNASGRERFNQGVAMLAARDRAAAARK